MIGCIRGATTCSNEEQDILQSVCDLFEDILQKNAVQASQVCCVFVSSTQDITKVYPAKGIRRSEHYHNGIALFSSCEPMIENSLQGCIRLLVQIQENQKTTDKDVCKNTVYKHIYHKGAKILRPDIAYFTIAIDGPSGAGKSTLAKILAGKLGIPYLDTGAMYRSLAVKLLDEGLYSDACGLSLAEPPLQAWLQNTSIEFVKENDKDKVYLDGQDVTQRIREHHISQIASAVSANKTVRLSLVEMQRQIASKSSCVLDGRDIGTFVLPKADYKFFVTASVIERAKRRQAQLKSKGQMVDFNTLKQDIVQRDFNDSNREFAPLRQAQDAVLIDTTKLSVQKTVEQMMQHIAVGNPHNV
ncbi:MAG: (d)CMP kinase [Firmicutes bacterium]|nr:(d)CMP kinase [Bacillota bacterium]